MAGLFISNKTDLLRKFEDFKTIKYKMHNKINC